MTWAAGGEMDKMPLRRPDYGHGGVAREPMAFLHFRKNNMEEFYDYPKDARGEPTEATKLV
jgi:hypothetical protein